MSRIGNLESNFFLDLQRYLIIVIELLKNQMVTGHILLMIQLIITINTIESFPN